MTDNLQISLRAIRRWPTPTARRWLERFIADATSDRNVLAVVAVGSTVRRKVPSEDLDLVVVCRERLRFRYRPPIEVDVRTLAVDSVNGELACGSPLLGWAARFGAALLDRKANELSGALRRRGKILSRKAG